MKLRETCACGSSIELDIDKDGDVRVMVRQGGHDLGAHQAWVDRHKLCLPRVDMGADGVSVSPSRATNEKPGK